MILHDKHGCAWRPNPKMPGEFQILIEETHAWSDADLMHEDAPLTGRCELENCRICPIKAAA